MIEKVKELSQFEMIGVEKTTIQIMSDIFGIQLNNFCWTSERIWENETILIEEFGKWRSAFLISANNLILHFEDEEENETYYRWNIGEENLTEITEKELNR